MSSVRPVFSYDPGEKLADLLIHILGVGFALIGGGILLALTPGQAGAMMGAALYTAALVAMLGFSAAYNLSPAGAARDVLRRCDHAAIFIMIAGTFSGIAFARPEMDAGSAALIWGLALAGAGAKLVLPHRFEAVALPFYLGLGWLSLAALFPVLPQLPDISVILMVAGGVLYSTGVGFHLWESLRFHNAIWHGLVLAAAVCHYGAIVTAF